jgi:Tol biopolymer transport system component
MGFSADWKWLVSRWGLALFLGLAAIAVAPARPVAAQGNGGAVLTVVAPVIPVREGPSISDRAVGLINLGEQVPVIGPRTDDGWWPVRLADATRGWIRDGADLVSITGEPPKPVKGAALQATTALTGTVVFQTTSGGDIYVISADGTGLRKLTTGLDPALSPDGKQVAFSRWEFPYGLYVINVDGTGERQLLGTPMLKAPAWSPDGTRIAFAYQNGGHISDWIRETKVKDPTTGQKRLLDVKMRADARWRLGVASAADGQFTELDGHEYSFSPTWSADGKHIAYASDKGLSLTWEGVGAAASRDPNTYTLSDRRFVDRAPAWSPDDTRIAFQNRANDYWEILVMNADGSGRTLLTKSPFLAKVPVSSVSPTWSPDSAHIAYLSNAGGKWNIWVMNADGSNQRPMFKAGTLDSLTLEYNNVDERVLSWQ